MTYEITAKISSKETAEMELKSNNLNFVFHTIMAVVENTQEEAYETGSCWEVTVTKEDSKISFLLESEYIRTIIDGKDKGFGFWDSQLSNWV